MSDQPNRYLVQARRAAQVARSRAQFLKEQEAIDAVVQLAVAVNDLADYAFELEGRLEALSGNFEEHRGSSDSHARLV